MTVLCINLLLTLTSLTLSDLEMHLSPVAFHHLSVVVFVSFLRCSIFGKAIFSYSVLFSAFTVGVLMGIFQNIRYGLTRTMVLLVIKKFGDGFSCFHTVHVCDRYTNRIGWPYKLTWWPVGCRGCASRS